MTDDELRELASRVKAGVESYPDYDRTTDEDHAIRLADEVLARLSAGTLPPPAEGTA